VMSDAASVNGETVWFSIRSPGTTLAFSSTLKGLSLNKVLIQASPIEKSSMLVVALDAILCASKRCSSIVEIK